MSIFPVFYELDWAMQIFKPLRLSVRGLLTRAPRAQSCVAFRAVALNLNAKPWLRASTVRKRTDLLLVVNGLAAQFLPVRACTVNDDRA